MTKEERLNHALAWLDRIKTYDTELTSNRLDAEKFYFSNALGNEVEGRSKIVTSDIADTIEWIMPAIVRVFCSGDEVCKLQPRGQEDAHAVELNNELTNYQLRVRNKWFVVIHDFVKDALLNKIGVIKYSWEKKTETIKKIYVGLTLEELYVKSLEPNTKIITATPNATGDMYDIELELTLEDEFPLIEAVPPHEIGFPKETRDLDKCAFLYHKIQMYPYEIADEYGKEALKKLKGTKDAYASSMDIIDSDAVENARFEDLGGVDFMFDTTTDKYWVYECYFTEPETGEHRQLTICGTEVLEDVENEYKRPPFHIFTPIRLSHRVIGRSIFDVLKDLQRLRTTLFRQVLDNLYFSNSGRFIADPDRVNFDDLLNNNVPGGAIRGDPSALTAITPPPLQPWTFQLLEYVQGEKENKTGVTRYNQGSGGQSLNKTARGINALLSQSQQRIDLIARSLAETAIAPLINSVMDMNIRFLSKRTMLRICNDWAEVTPDNIIGKWDVIVNVGVGVADKETTVAQMQQLLGIYAQIVKSGLSIATPKNVYNACKELTKAMGYRNVDDFWTDPDKVPPQIPMQTQEQAPMEQAINGGTMPGAEPAAIPEQPTQPGQPRLDPTGGGFYG